MTSEKSKKSVVLTTDVNTKQRARGAASQRKLLKAANDVFWSNGFSASTIAQIVEASELSVGSFYHQFSGKDELLQVCIAQVLEDFEHTLSKLDMSFEVNQNLFTVMYRIAVSGRKLIARNRGVYRALSELTQTNSGKYGSLQIISPTTAKRVMDVIDSYGAKKTTVPSSVQVDHAVQLIAMSVLQTELGMGPLFPKSRMAFGKMLASAACGILGCDIPVGAEPHCKL